MRENTINFSKAAFELLGKPEGLEIFTGGGKIAVRVGADYSFAKRM